MLLQMTAIGEESGSLDDMLGKVANHYEAAVDNAGRQPELSDGAHDHVDSGCFGRWLDGRDVHAHIYARICDVNR